MQRFHAFLFSALLVTTSAVTSLIVAFVVQPSQPSQSYGVSLPQGPAVFETSLQSRISSTDTSMTLVANSVRGGSTLSGYQCFTIDEGRTDAEFVCGTISGTSVTGLERGIDPLTATTTNATLKFAHRVGANVKITDFPLIQRLRNLANAVEFFPTLLQYATTTTLCTSGSSNFTICDKAYVDSTANAGASDANETTKGIGELATGAEAAAGTSLGSMLARLILPNSLASSTPTASCSFCVPVAVSGKLAQAFLNLTQHFAFSSLFATNASTTNATTTNLSINGVSYGWPSSQGAANSVMVNNGSGTLAWTVYVATTSSSTIASLDTFRTTVNSTSFVKLKDFEVNAGGAYSFQWRQRTSNAANTCSVVISRDGLATSTQSDYAGTASTTRNVDLGGFVAGSNAQLYALTSQVNGEHCQVDNWKIQASFAPSGTIVTD